MTLKRRTDDEMRQIIANRTAKALVQMRADIDTLRGIGTWTELRVMEHCVKELMYQTGEIQRQVSSPDMGEPEGATNHQTFTLCVIGATRCGMRAS